MATLAPQSYLTGIDGHCLFSEALSPTSFYDSYTHMVGQESLVEKVDELEQLLLLDANLQTDFLLNSKKILLLLCITLYLCSSRQMALSSVD